jgi:hypothetical protein
MLDALQRVPAGSRNVLRYSDELLRGGTASGGRCGLIRSLLRLQALFDSPETSQGRRRRGAIGRKRDALMSSCAAPARAGRIKRSMR